MTMDGASLTRAALVGIILATEATEAAGNPAGAVVMARASLAREIMDLGTAVTAQASLERTTDGAAVALANLERAADGAAAIAVALASPARDTTLKEEEATYQDVAAAKAPPLSP